MPENAVSVTRPGKWGNPFVIGSYYMRGDHFGRAAGSLVMSYTCTSKEHADTRYSLIENNAQAVEWFRWYKTSFPDKDIKKLRGKDLACWCPLDQPCHADVLLEIANS